MSPKNIKSILPLDCVREVFRKFEKIKTFRVPPVSNIS